MATIVGTNSGETLDGTALDDVIWGLGGDDILNGALGNDRLIGGIGDDILNGDDGNDRFDVDSADDVVNEAAGQGDDRIYASVTYGLKFGSSVEILTTADNRGTAAINLTGNAFNNVLQGNDGDNILDGGDGNDRLNGLGGADILNGGGGNDRLFGGTGTDSMNGGIGDDLYYIDNANDIVNENGGEGSDRIYASVSYVLQAGRSVEILTTDNNNGIAVIDLTGNEFNNLLQGNAADNILNGGAGNDTLNGFGGDDTLNGGDGNDTLFGKEGADTMNGGSGDDRYFVDSADDIVNEAAGQGADRVIASVSYALRSGASVETLMTDREGVSAAINLTGNELNNVLRGNVGVNVLTGGGGNDELQGLAGNDILNGGDGNDLIYGGAGTDTLNGGAGRDWLDGGKFYDTMNGGTGDDSYIIGHHDEDIVNEARGEGFDVVYVDSSYTLTPGSEIEELTLYQGFATFSALELVGNDFGQRILGSLGDDTLDGRGGNDTLVSGDGLDTVLGGAGNDRLETILNRDNSILNGGSGDDTFYFTGSLGDAIVRIEDFNPGVDTFELENADTFSRLNEGHLSADAFIVGATAQDSNDRIIYNSATGALSYDPDGTGAAAAVQFATLTNIASLTNGDFLVV